MEIEVFNQTSEDLEEELSFLKTMLLDFCKREKLDNVIFNIIIVDEEKIHSINKMQNTGLQPTFDNLSCCGIKKGS